MDIALQQHPEYAFARQVWQRGEHEVHNSGIVKLCFSRYPCVLLRLYLRTHAGKLAGPWAYSMSPLIALTYDMEPSASETEQQNAMSKAQLLLRHGVDPMCERAGETAYDIAARKKHVILVAFFTGVMLIEHPCKRQRVN